MKEKRMDLVIKHLDIAEMKYIIEMLEPISDIDFSVVKNDNFDSFNIADILPVVCGKKGELKIG